MKKKEKIDLREYQYKDVEVTCTDGTVVTGHVLSLAFPDETESGEMEIDLENRQGILGLRQHEIADIREIKD